MSTDPDEVMMSVEEGMQKAVDHTLHEFNSIHTGKASPSMVENISVEVYGSAMQLKDIAAITTPDSRTIVVQPWDKTALNDANKALQVAAVILCFQ